MTPQLMTADAEGQAAPTPPHPSRRCSADHVTAEQALAALDSLDDFARMSVGVDPFGPRGVLELFIAQATPPHPAQAPQTVGLTDEQIVAAANEAFDTTIDLDDDTLVNKYGHGVYISRYLDFARAIERSHGITSPQATQEKTR